MTPYDFVKRETCDLHVNLPWLWRQRVSTEIVVLLSYHADGVRDSYNNFISTKPYGITNQKTLIVLLIAARAPNLAGIKKTHLLIRFWNKNCTVLYTSFCKSEGGQERVGGGQHKVLSPCQASQLVYASTVSFRRSSAHRGATNIFSVVPE